MVKKIISGSLLIIGIFVALVLFTYGGPAFPHIIGPIVFVGLGLYLLLYKRTDK